jgi:hypothetical protein
VRSSFITLTDITIDATCEASLLLHRDPDGLRFAFLQFSVMWLHGTAGVYSESVMVGCSPAVMQLSPHKCTLISQPTWASVMRCLVMFSCCLPFPHVRPTSIAAGKTSSDGHQGHTGIQLRGYDILVQRFAIRAYMWHDLSVVRSLVSSIPHPHKLPPAHTLMRRSRQPQHTVCFSVLVSTAMLSLQSKRAIEGSQPLY